MKSRADNLRRAEPELIADLWLYSTEQGGRRFPIKLGWGCPCTAQKTVEGTLEEGWDGWPLLGDDEMKPGETKKSVGFIFLSGKEAADLMKTAGKFYLWDGRFIGEAIVTT